MKFFQQNLLVILYLLHLLVFLTILNNVETNLSYLFIPLFFKSLIEVINYFIFETNLQLKKYRFISLLLSMSLVTSYFEIIYVCLF